MAPPRLPETRKRAKRNEVDEPARPVNMIPQLIGVQPREETTLLVLDLAEHLHPGVDHIGKLDKQSRAHWIVLASGILREYPDISQYLDTLSEVLARGVNAEIDDILQRLEADLKEKKRRAEEEERERAEQQQREEDIHAENIADQQQQRTQSQEEWSIQKEILGQKRDREKQRDATGHTLELIFIGMAVASFTLAVCLLTMAAIVGHGDAKTLSLASPGLALAFGGTGATGLFSLVLLALHRVRHEGNEPADPASTLPAEDNAIG
jgi:hypothetical protein